MLRCVHVYLSAVDAVRIEITEYRFATFYTVDLSICYVDDLQSMSYCTKARNMEGERKALHKASKQASIACCDQCSW